MGEQIDPDEDLIERESVEWNFTVYDIPEDVDLTALTVEWYLLPSRGDDPADAHLSHESEGVTTSMTEDGTAIVEIGPSVTEGLAGKHWHVLEIGDGVDHLRRWSGAFPINRI